MHSWISRPLSDKSQNLPFAQVFWELCCLKNCKISPKVNTEIIRVLVKKVWFFRHFKLPFSQVALFVNFHAEYVIQMMERHLYALSNQISFAPNSRNHKKKKPSGLNLKLCLHFWNIIFALSHERSRQCRAPMHCAGNNIARRDARLVIYGVRRS